MQSGLSIVVVLMGGFVPSSAAAQGSDPLSMLATEFWSWRAVHQPVAGDDIPRIDRPDGWLPDWAPATVRQRIAARQDFQRRWEAIDTTGWSVPRQVDYRLLGSAIARVEWELEVYPTWRRNPLFYVQQTLGSVFRLLLSPTPFDETRSSAIVRRLEQIPVTARHARENLTDAIRPFAELAIDEFDRAGDRLREVEAELAPHLVGHDADRLPDATREAIAGLEALRDWLRQQAPSMPTETAIGREAYRFFLHHVALIPYEPEELVRMARQEWERAVAFETFEAQRNRGLPQLKLFGDAQEQIAREALDEVAIRRLLEERGILSVPDWMRHYRNLPMPAYLAPLAHLGVTDDLTGPTRLDEDGISYIWPPAPDLPYFNLSTARDPRPIIVHEGVPGHYFQLALSWAHEDPIRRHYYDSGANEGIGFYAEEMMLQAGLWEDSPRSREIIYNFMRLRALRVEVDVKLALGEFQISEAGHYLTETVPMDAGTADDEAAFFASAPGQAISYQIGKLQILRFLTDARQLRGSDFNLRNFHDYLWKNGNVPIALLRWERLGLGGEVAFLDAQGR